MLNIKSLVIWIFISLTLINEGVLRDVVNRVQRLRKEFKIIPTDELVVYFQVANQESKLNALLNRSVEYLETNIKKPVRLYDSSLTLNVKGKVFEVKFQILNLH